MSEPADTPFDDVQRIVLRGGARPGEAWQAVSHLLVDFGERSPLHFINQLVHGRADPSLPPLTIEGTTDLKIQVSLGLTRRGLERAHVPDHLLTLMALKAPAFHAGAARRAARHLALSGPSAAELWDWGRPPGPVASTGPDQDRAFRFDAFDAVVSLHGSSAESVVGPLAALQRLAAASGMRFAELPQGQTLAPPVDLENPPSAPRQGPGQWVHFGYLDGLSKTGIKGVTSAQSLARLKPLSRHEAGEFVLGHVQDSGGNPWVAGPGLRVWPEDARAFFHNGSFGVLQLIEQDVKGFATFVQTAASATGLSHHDVKGKLCGRTPDGRPLAASSSGDDFDYEDDKAGLKCPFGSHVRRMNPRLPTGEDGRVLLDQTAGQEQHAHGSRRRPLLRRGMPYGAAWTGEVESTPPGRGLIGHFFCASIEDQFEHLLGEWADRVAMGSPDRGGARDPFIGAHEPGDGPFDMPQPPGQPAKQLRGLTPFTRTRGCAYLFYPSLRTLEGIAASFLWAPDPYSEDDA